MLDKIRNRFPKIRVWPNFSGGKYRLTPTQHGPQQWPAALLMIYHPILIIKLVCPYFSFKFIHSSNDSDNLITLFLFVSKSTLWYLAVNQINKISACVNQAQRCLGRNIAAPRSTTF